MARVLRLSVIAICLFSIGAHAWFAVVAGSASQSHDFACLYYGSHVALDTTLSNNIMYEEARIAELYPRYMERSPFVYNYSVLAAYVLAPLMLLPFPLARLAWGVINLLAYLTAVWWWLARTKNSSDLLWVGLLIALIWTPLIHNQDWLQSNPLVLLIVAAGIVLAHDRHPWAAGLLFGLGASIKLLPLVVAGVLIFKNWRTIFAACSVVGLALVLPGGWAWVEQLLTYEHQNINPLRIALGSGPFAGVVVVVVLTTAFFAYRCRSKPVLALAAVALPAGLIVSPVVAGYYLVLLIPAFLFVLAVRDRLAIWQEILVWLSWGSINIAVAVGHNYMGAVVVLWLTCLSVLARLNTPRLSRTATC